MASYPSGCGLVAHLWFNHVGFFLGNTTRTGVTPVRVCFLRGKKLRTVWCATYRIPMAVFHPLLGWQGTMGFSFDYPSSFTY